MKLEIKVGDRTIVEPDFKIYTLKNKGNVIIIAMSVSSVIESKVKKSLVQDEFKIEMDNGVVGLFVSDSIYSFDIGYFIKTNFNNYDHKIISVGLAFLDVNDKIKKDDLTIVEMVSNWIEKQ